MKQRTNGDMKLKETPIIHLKCNLHLKDGVKNWQTLVLQGPSTDGKLSSLLREVINKWHVLEGRSSIPVNLVHNNLQLSKHRIIFITIFPYFYNCFKSVTSLLFLPSFSIVLKIMCIRFLSSKLLTETSFMRQDTQIYSFYFVCVLHSNSSWNCILYFTWLDDLTLSHGSGHHCYWPDECLCHIYVIDSSSSEDVISSKTDDSDMW